MKKPVAIIVAAFVIFFGVIVAGPFFVINEGEQAVVVRLGRIVNVVTDAGLHVRIPFIDEVIRYPRKIMTWDGEARIVPTAERQFIFVDVTARWRISDPEVFYQAIRTVSQAQSRLTQVIDSAVLTVVAENPLIESVRNSNIIMERSPAADLYGDEFEAEIVAILQGAGHDPITRGRRQLAEEILVRSRQIVPEYGIELIDILTRQIRYSDELTPSVYARMIRERNQWAQAYRSDGEGRRAEWLGRMESERLVLLSAAYYQAQTIRAQADARAAGIFADAYNQNRDFFNFWRAIEAYRITLSGFDRKILSTDMDFFRYFFSPNGR
ncbi:MAG: protease modulator HflC [Treponema sp.]|nr:protease modulator HflC [Treponema sp.]